MCFWLCKRAYSFSHSLDMVALDVLGLGTKEILCQLQLSVLDVTKNTY